MRHCEESELWKKVYFGLLFQRDRTPSRWGATGACGRHSDRSRKLRCLQQQRKSREQTGNKVRLWTPKAHPQGRLPPARPHPLNLPKQTQLLGRKYSSTWASGGNIAHLNHHALWKKITEWIKSFRGWLENLNLLEENIKGARQDIIIGNSFLNSSGNKNR